MAKTSLWKKVLLLAVLAVFAKFVHVENAVPLLLDNLADVEGHEDEIEKEHCLQVREP